MMMMMTMIIMIIIKQYQPSERASELHVLAETTMWKKCNNNNLLAPDESRIPRNSNEVMHERTKEQFNTLKPRTQQRGWDCCVAGQSQDVDVDASMKTMAPGTWTELILSESELTKRLRLRSNSNTWKRPYSAINGGYVLDGKVIKQLRINDVCKIKNLTQSHSSIWEESFPFSALFCLLIAFVKTS